MEPWRRFLSYDSRRTLEFFFTELTDVVSGDEVDDRALLYNASVLAHFASTSTAASRGVPTPVSLVDVFDRFVLDRLPQVDPELLETAAAQCLLLTGFFRDQLKSRFNLDWYGELGAGFFESAAARSRSDAHRWMMSHMAGEFGAWRLRHLQLARTLRMRPYLLGG